MKEEERRQLEQTDRKRMRSSSILRRLDMRLRSSIGSSDQSTSAIDAAADSLLLFFISFSVTAKYQTMEAGNEMLGADG
ncbi:hypothetical protein A2U01_0008064 [Trifolium medium]|uniref:Uncharacterized protein n=1 Tax=Trifolium medium TaxID=97028 RepID=A0A392MKE6_9FABA|nr:hypothetical protein [Trifolium medium]